MVLSSETFVDKLWYYNVQYIDTFKLSFTIKMFYIEIQDLKQHVNDNGRCLYVDFDNTRGTFSFETVTIVDLSLRVVSIIMNTLICITIVVQTCYTRSIHFSCNLLWADEHYGMFFKSLKCRKRLGYISTDCPMSSL